MGGIGAITEWKDIPMELLLRIVSLVDDQTVIFVSGVGTILVIGYGLVFRFSSWSREITLFLVVRTVNEAEIFFRCKNSMNNLVLSLAPKLRNLQTLVLRQDKPQLLDNAIETIANCCHDLQDLDLSKSFKLSDHSLYALAHGCPNLVKLNISGCSAFSDTALVYLASSCRKIKYLNLCGCVKAASDKALKAIGHNCNQLKSLNLGWCEQVGDAGVECLAYGCPDLRALDLCGCVLITDDSVVALANNCLHLRSLGLYYCQNITDKAMYSLAYSRVKNKREMLKSTKNRYEEEGLMNLKRQPVHGPHSPSCSGAHRAASAFSHPAH
ncbi:RNI-like superfamily protein [Actinidia rufa]|uniref:RNI-like superfamily protein n=1 Tax=Actinidia rufa TaxID=165716 RepID=A0A7J0DAS5_9ERIC|nr:RNI-like superfamily protein [Actinidia rufa]